MTSACPKAWIFLYVSKAGEGNFVLTCLTSVQLKAVKDLRPSAEFRNIWQYNNHMYNIAASLVRRITGSSFFDFAREHLFEAIGFKNTRFYSRELVASGRVSEGFIKFNETSNSAGTLLAVEPWEDMDLWVPGAGCILSNADNLVRCRDMLGCRY